MFIPHLLFYFCPDYSIKSTHTQLLFLIYCKKQFKIQQRFKNVSRETITGCSDCLKGSIKLFHKMFHVKQWQDDPDCLKGSIKLFHKMFHVKQWQDDPDCLKESSCFIKCFT